MTTSGTLDKCHYIPVCVYLHVSVYINIHTQFVIRLELEILTVQLKVWVFQSLIFSYYKLISTSIWSNLSAKMTPNCPVWQSYGLPASVKVNY